MVYLQRAGLSYKWWLGSYLIKSVITAAVFFGAAPLLFLRKRTDWFGLYLAFTLFLLGLAVTAGLRVMAGQYPYQSFISQPFRFLAWPLFFVIFFPYPLMGKE